MPTVSQASFIPKNIIRKIASVTGVDANSLASTALAFEPGLSLANAMPSFAIVKYRTGTVAAAVVRLDIGAVPVGPLAVLIGMTATKPSIFNVLSSAGTVVDISQSLQLSCTTVNTSAMTVDCDVFGAVY